MSYVYVARQPIVNEGREVVGYELLFRDSASATTAVIQGDGTAATASLLTNSVLIEGSAGLTGGLEAWLNLTEELILSDVAKLLSPKQCVIEVLESVRPLPEVLERCRGLRAAGFRLALDDVTDVMRLKDFEGCFDIVKVDWRAASEADIVQIVTEGKRQGATLLAEKVETDAELGEAIARGFLLFQGYAIGRPVSIERRKLHSFGAQTLRLLEIVSANQIEYADAERVVTADPALLFKVLAFARSSVAAQTKRVASVRQALVLFGENNLRHAAMLVFLSQTAGAAPSFALEEALVAGLFCESLATGAKRTAISNACMLAATLSHMDRLLGLSMDEVVERLPVDGALLDALLSRSGELGHFVQLARSFQDGDWIMTEALVRELGLKDDTLDLLYGQAITKAERLVHRYDEEGAA